MGPEYAPRRLDEPLFFDPFAAMEGMDGFDIDAAFQDAMTTVASDQELALDEKVRRMETILSEGSSDVYQEFVDFSMMAAQMEMLCNHDHALQQSIQQSELLSGFLDTHREDGHDHSNDHEDKRKQGKERKKKAKKKKTRGWFGVFYDA